MSGTPRIKEVHEDEGWLITFADMCVLLMCFFVLLFSVSKPDEEQFKSLSESLRKAGFDSDSVQTEDPYEKLKKEISLSIGQSGYDQFMFATETPKSINVELSSGAFFVVGSAKFTPDAIPMLEMVSKQLNTLAKSEIIIEVEGHTDDSPVSSAQFPSNWELSAARAANVVRFMIAQGFPPQKMRVVGYGSTQPKAENRDAAGNPIAINQEMNRRVVVRMLKGEDM